MGCAVAERLTRWAMILVLWYLVSLLRITKNKFLFKKMGHPCLFFFYLRAFKQAL